MMQKRLLTVARFRLGLAAAAMAAGLAPAHGEDASAWASDAHSQVRLIAGTNAPRQPTLRAGIDIKLAPGWKTYWRYPGDSGVPPRFDFAASRNVKDVQVLWPAPERMAEAGGQSIGYHGRVIMPLKVMPIDPAQPVLLNLKLDYAVCEKLCVPAQAAAKLTLAPAASSQDADLKQAEARVPKPSKLGAGDPLAIRTVRRDDGGARPRVIVDVAVPQDVEADLFAEGPTPAWALPLPEPNGSPAPGLKRFSFELDGLPADATPKGAELTLTLVAGAKAIEAKTRLD
jgi:DsbC/DsbD-like thiol-disulfide interchange protein